MQLEIEVAKAPIKLVKMTSSLQFSTILPILPRTPAQWLKEIKLAIADAARSRTVCSSRRHRDKARQFVPSGSRGVPQVSRPQIEGARGRSGHQNGFGE
jgi:hypothetical protein